MATAWDVASFGWAITVVGWLVSPIITLLLPKILACLGFDPSQKLHDLEFHIIPELENTLRTVDKERMMQRASKTKFDVAALDKMAAELRHAREDTEDIFDDAQERIVCSDILADALQTFRRSCLGIACVVGSRLACLLQSTRRRYSSWFIGSTSGEAMTIISAAASNEPGLVAIDISGSDESVPVTASVAAAQEPADPTSDTLGRWLSCFCSSFDLFKHCWTSTFNWLRFYRDWSYEAAGFTSYQLKNATLLDIFLTAISRRKLKKRVEKVETTIREVKKSPLLEVASNITPNVVANKNRRRLGAASKRKVFGREVLRDDIMARLRDIPQCDAPSSSTSLCYSVIGIYGVAGCGKTTFAGYIRDYIKEECKEKLFDTIMCIHVSENFIVEDIFEAMLKDISEDSHSNISDRGSLNGKLKEALCGKRFFLILDDLWVKSKNDQQLEELISPLIVGLEGSKILVTARTKDAAAALCADEPIEMPDLDEDQYLKMFMHYALGGTSVPVKEFEEVGRLIATKLHSSPIAAVTVGGRLGTNRDMGFWKNTANHETFNETMDALWWSYQQLNPDIRRCLEYCNIFPRRLKLEKDKLVNLWIAQGFVKISHAAEDMEDVAESYIQELVSHSFLQPEGTSSGCFRIHDLLHDLLDKVTGCDCFGIENGKGQREGCIGDVPQDVSHLFVQNYDGELITKKILGLKKLRTLIIYIVEKDTPVEEKVLESICLRLPKLRVLAIAFNKKCRSTSNLSDKFLVPESIFQSKHLRYLAFPKGAECKVILPSALAKLLHIQLLDFGLGKISDFTCAADLINLRHIFCSYVSFPNIGRLSSLQTIPAFTVRNEEGYEIKQLRNLNKIRGSLVVDGLENVKSKEEALEANLAAKERLMELTLIFPDYNDSCTPEAEAEVLEGLCSPVGLEKLSIFFYSGSRYPDWMVGKPNGGLQKLEFWYCGQLGPGPQLDAFPHLHMLKLVGCSWDALPGNMEHLTSLGTLEIHKCMNIRSLPTLPHSLKELKLESCDDELMKGCQTEGDLNWLKIKHIHHKHFDPRITWSTSQQGPSHASEAYNVIVRCYWIIDREQYY